MPNPWDKYPAEPTGPAPWERYAPDQPAAPAAVPLSDPSVTGFVPPHEFLARPEVQADLAENGPGRARAFIQTTVPVAAGLAFTPPAGFAARATLAALFGAGSSFASEAVDPSQSASQAMVRAAAGAGAGVVGEGLGAGFARAAPAIRRFAENQGAKALGFIQGQLKQAGPEGARAVARTALDEGVISPLASAETMRGRAQSVHDRAGSTLGWVRDQIDQLSPGQSVQPILNDVETALRDWVPGISDEPVLLRHLSETLNDIKVHADPATGTIGAVALGKLKKLLGGRVYTNALQVPETLAGALAPRTETARGIIQGAEEAAADQVGLLDTMLPAKRVYGAMEKLIDPRAGTLVAREARDLGNNQVFGMGSSLAGIGAGAATANPVVGIGALLGGRFAHQRGNQIAATAANQMARLAASPAGQPIAHVIARSAAQAIVASLEER